MTILSDKPSAAFDSLFALTNIQEVYEDAVAWNAHRGIDRISPLQFDRRKAEHFDIIRDKCLVSTYNFAPFLEKLRLRGRDRPPRVLSIATIRDRVVLTLLKEYLHQTFPECLNKKLPNSYIDEIKNFFVSNNKTDLCLYKVDIESFYDHILHKKLLETLAERITSKPELVLIKRAISTQTVPSDHRRADAKKKNLCGVPQGLAISNILANIYLHNFDETFNNSSVKYLRYVDDMLFVVKTSERESLETKVEQVLGELGLNTSKKPGKTICVPINGAVDYLGYHLELPTVSIKQVTVERYLHSVSTLFSKYAHLGPTGMYPGASESLGQKLFIEDVNEKITGAISENKRYGWLFYFLEMNDLPLLYSMDTIIRNKFFGRLKNPSFRPAIDDIKKLSRAYYEAKYHPLGKYIHNYNEYDTIDKKREYLNDRGQLETGKTYSPAEIERLFNRIKKKHLTALEADVGETS